MCLFRGFKLINADSLRHRLTALGQWIGQRPWLALPVLVLPALRPFQTLGLPRSADGALHLLRLALLDYHLSLGTLYPRWLPELVVGLGYPLFSFYSPSTYYLGEALHLLGLSLPAALMAAFAVLVIVAGFGMYRLACDVLGQEHRWAALLAAVAYMYAPYLLTNVYIRGAIAEVGAQALLPWILWSWRRLITADKPASYLLPAALSLGGLALTHTISLVLLPPLLVGYILVLWWASGHQSRQLGWIAAGLGAAMGASAVFWLPLLVERSFLSEAAFRNAAIYLPENLWTWTNFLDLNGTFEYTFDIPFQLGLLQLGLAAAGLIVARRWDTEWLFFLAVSLVAGLGMAAVTQPIWLSNPILLIAQFPWRLLTVLSVPLALFTGALVLRLRRKEYQAIASLAIAFLIIAVNQPRVDWMQVLARGDEQVRLAAVAQFERETGALGTSSAAEFMPKWSLTAEYAATDELATQLTDVQISKASSLGLQAQVSSPQGGPLRFYTFYFPGWRVSLDGVDLDTYPSTNLGLLTVDLPPGAHQLEVAWSGTAVQKLAMILSLGTLALLAVYVWQRTERRYLALLPGALLVWGLAAGLSQEQPVPVQLPRQAVGNGQLAMVGYRLASGLDDSLIVHPYWHVLQTPSPAVRMHWQLRNAAGEVVSDVVARPFFNSGPAGNWPAGTIVDDVYRIPLPSSLAAGQYDLVARIESDSPEDEWAQVGTVELAAPQQGSTASVQPAFPLEVQLGDAIQLAGVDLAVNKDPVATLTDGFVVVEPGDLLEFVLYWQALAPLDINYHGFVHLVDKDGQAVAKLDHLAGSYFWPSLQWDESRLETDHYRLSIPDEASSGLYWPTTGLYDFETLELLPVTTATGEALGESFKLPPMKVLRGGSRVSPQHELDVRLDDVATLLGYDLTATEADLRPGSQLTVTLYYQATGPTSQDLTQFVHLYNPQLGMAAQYDAPPVGGANPTGTWVAGEIIVDELGLRIADNAVPGSYVLLVGLYNPRDGSRVPVMDAEGKELPDGQAALRELQVLP